MKLVKPSFEILEQEPGYEGMLRHIERCGRTCYKSEDKITKASAKKFVDMLVKRGHTAMVEHGTIYLAVLDSLPGGFGGPAPEKESTMLDFYLGNKYSDVVEEYIGMGAYEYYITTNYRVLLQNGRLGDLEYQCEPSEHHVKRVTVKFICDRGVSHEFVRHRVFSFAQESTRYCNYSKDKFGKECTFIIPSWLNLSEGGYKWEDQNPLLTAGLSIEEAGYDDSSDLWFEDNDGDFIEYKRHYLNWQETETFMHSLQVSEQLYLELLDRGWKPQQARAV